jgi:FdhE protein
MAQRILEPGQIETLAQRSIPRVRLPGRDTLFASRAARLRALGRENAIGGYLQFLAVIAEAQQRAIAALTVALPDAACIAQAATHRMPPVPASGWTRDPRWIEALHDIARDVAIAEAMPDAVGAICARIRSMPREEIERMADALLADEAIDVASAPIVMAALQVHWVALTKAFKAETVAALDVPGVCPLCGTLPVASIVRAQSPYQGYRYLHCALCATEWHMVRVHCSSCGADGKQVAYHALQGADATDASTAVQDAAVRAEACETCHSYRKILYQEKDIAVDAVADDVATLALDILLGTQGFHRASGNPLFWQAAQDG